MISMGTYIALLRGINVTGHNKIKMTELKQLFIDSGFREVVTYIQSGNVIFQSEQSDISKIEQSIIKVIEKHFGYSIKVLVVTKSHLAAIFNSNPFIERENIDLTKLYVTLLSNQPEIDGIEQIEELLATNDDAFEVIDKSVYLYCPNGYGRTKLNNNLFEKKLNSSATTRNWKTITKLIELSNQ